jgi:hypothetical protein
MDVARSRLAMATGIRTHDRRSWGRKANDSIRNVGAALAGVADVRYSRTL